MKRWRKDTARGLQGSVKLEFNEKSEGETTVESLEESVVKLGASGKGKDESERSFQGSEDSNEIKNVEMSSESNDVNVIIN